MQTMPKAARNQEPAAAESAAARAGTARKRKIPVLLVTSDDMLWPQVGADLSPGFALSALDSIDELLSSTPANTPAIVLWDARGHDEAAQTLSSMQLHSPCFAVVILDEPRNAGAWTLPLQHRQVIAHVTVPVSGSALAKSIESAAEEVLARSALLGGTAAPQVKEGMATASPPAARGRLPLKSVAIGVVVLAAVVAWFLTRHGGDRPAVPLPRAAALKEPDTNQEKLDALIERAQLAMNDRHFIDPSAGSALALYRDALLINPANGEAKQGLERLAAILVARIQAALDERKFDVALQSLETARSINVNDARLPAFDEKIAALRAELGPAQIAAAINAQNFDRALQLIDDATRAKSLPAGKLAQLRDEVRKRREDADQGRLLKLVDTRLQQDRLVEPRSDSAAYYLEQARQAGVAPAQLQTPTQELQRKLAQAVRTAIEQRHFGDADRGIADLRELAAPSVAGLQRELITARSGAMPAAAATPTAADLVQQRLVQGRLAEPDNDSALYFLSQLRAADPKSTALATLGSQLQAQLLERARGALDSGDLARAETSLQQAQSLGASADADTLAERVRAGRVAATETPQVTEQSLTRLAKLEIAYPARAQQSHVEGWVEIGYLVKADGSVTSIKIVNASPAGAFEQAATRAVSKLRYQPVMRDGKAIAVGTQLRVIFRIPP